MSQSGYLPWEQIELNLENRQKTVASVEALLLLPFLTSFVSENRRKVGRGVREADLLLGGLVLSEGLSEEGGYL